MTRKSNSSKTLVVLERGSDWPDWLESATLGYDIRRVVAQREHETLARFASRVARVTQSLVLDGETLALAVVGCNDRLDAGAYSARSRIARALASTLTWFGGGRLHFTASARQSGRSLVVLSEFARGLGVEWEGNGVTVSARFGAHGSTRCGNQLPANLAGLSVA
jgi:hypothetical protein